MARYNGSIIKHLTWNSRNMFQWIGATGYRSPRSFFSLTRTLCVSAKTPRLPNFDRWMCFRQRDEGWPWQIMSRLLPFKFIRDGVRLMLSYKYEAATWIWWRVIACQRFDLEDLYQGHQTSNWHDIFTLCTCIPKHNMPGWVFPLCTCIWPRGKKDEYYVNCMMYAWTFDYTYQF